MASTIDTPAFSLADLQLSAESLLLTGPDPIPRLRLLNEVLRVPPHDRELLKTRIAAENSQWVKMLTEAQLPDGSWGRFHSQDTKARAVFRTTEEAIDRAFALGLQPDQHVLAGVKRYIVNVLKGEAHITDREEKGEAWPLVIRFILEGRLAQIDPAEPLLEPGWKYLAEVTKQAFASGHYSIEDEAKAYLQLSRTRVPEGFLESQHALWILSSHPLPAQLEKLLLEWVWHKPDGMRYLRAPLSDPRPKSIVYWLRSMNIFTHFTTWRTVSLTTLNQLWECRDDQGLWDFGPQSPWCTDFPISESWRHKLKRKVDYSTCMLVLLRRFFDNSQASSRIVTGPSFEISTNM